VLPAAAAAAAGQQFEQVLKVKQSQQRKLLPGLSSMAEYIIYICDFYCLTFSRVVDRAINPAHPTT
jgi:hypothetical protein